MQRWCPNSITLRALQMCSATRRQTVAWSLVLPLDKWLRLYRNAVLAPTFEMRKDIIGKWCTLNCKNSVTHTHPPHHLCLKCERHSLLVKPLKNHVVLAASWVLQHLNIGFSGWKRTQEVTFTWWMRPWIRVFRYIIGYHRHDRSRHLCPLDETRVLASNFTISSGAKQSKLHTANDAVANIFTPQSSPACREFV